MVIFYGLTYTMVFITIFHHHLGEDMFGTFSRHRRVANSRVELTPKAEGTVGSLAEPFWITLPTVDGKNPKANHLGCIPNPANYGISTIILNW